MTTDPTAPRRAFLRRAITLVPASAALAACDSPGAPPTSSSAAAPTASAAAPPPYTPVFLNADEWAFVQAAVARLIPNDETGPGALEAGVPEFIDRQLEGAFGHGALWYTQGPFVAASPLFGYQAQAMPRELYRAAIAACNAQCVRQHGGKRFHELPAADQDAVLKGLEGGSLALENADGKAFFAFLLQNTREGFLSDPLHGGNKGAVGWKLIGFPGARGDFLDWVGRPGERYPLPPVTIAGAQG